MNKLAFYFIFLLFGAPLSFKASEKEQIETSFFYSNGHGGFYSSPNKLRFKLTAQFKKGRKLTAAALAFPLPFGFAGVHRMYLGTKPYVPLVYVGTVGGCLGVLPLIDFCVIVTEPDIDKLINNPRVFMWAE